MAWLKELFAAVLDWLTSLTRENTKASDADKTPEELKTAWRERIIEAERKADEDSKNNPTN